MVERAVIFSRDGTLPNPFHKWQNRPFVLNLQQVEDSDRALIVQTLEQVGWVVGGPRGAAAKLGLKRTTLIARMKRLGISRPTTQEGTEMVGMALESIS